MNATDFQMHRRLANRQEARVVLDETIIQSRLKLRIYDDRGEFYGFERPDFAAALSGFLRLDPRAQAVLILQDVQFLEQRCPRVLDVLRRYSPRLRILCSDETLREYARGMVIGDHGVVLTRPHFEHPAAFVDYDELAATAAQNVFDEIEMLARPGLSARTTGL